MTQTPVHATAPSLPPAAGPRPAGRDRPRPVRRRASRARAVRPAAVLAIVLAGQFMAVLDASVVNVAAPSIHAGLHASGAGLQLVIAGYTITYAVLLVSGARIGDLLGHRRMFLAGLAVFSLASLGCGLAGSTAQLVALRLVQGAGAAAMIPQVLSLIQRTFAGQSRARAMSAYSAVLAVGIVVGQVAGGVLVSANLFGATWRPVFLVNVPIGAVLMLAGWRLLPAGRGEAGRGLDIAGLALLTPAVLAVVIPLVLGQPEHWPAWGWLLLVGSVGLFGGFALVERRLAARGGSPLVHGRMLGLAGVRSGIAALFAVMTVFGGMFFALALHFQGGLGESPLRAGLTFAPSAAAFAVVSLNWQRLPARIKPWLPIGGFAGMSAGLVLLALVLRGGGSGGAWPFLALALIGASNAFAFSPLMTGVLMKVPVSDAADATGVVVTVNQLALVIGVASFGAIYLNLTGPLPADAAGAFRGLSAHAEFLTCLALAALAACGGALATARAWSHERSQSRPQAQSQPRAQSQPLAQPRPEPVCAADR
ncbi:MAG TPA: MFS transporter [Streptosporangiaceae bacterium]|nr:MFS transporter [Streptosporangiaceae bacterium]